MDKQRTGERKRRGNKEIQIDERGGIIEERKGDKEIKGEGRKRGEEKTREERRRVKV